MFYRFLCIFSAFLFLHSHSLAGQNPAILQKGKPVASELSGGQQQDYELKLAKGECARVNVQQRGVDVVIRVFGLNNDVILKIDDEFKNNGEENFDLVSEEAGTYRLNLRASSIVAPSGQYQIQITATRSANQKDRSLYEARKLEQVFKEALDEGKYSEAREIGNRALGIVEHVLGKEDLLYAMWLHLNADYYEIEQDYAKAVVLREQGLAIAEKVLGMEHLVPLNMGRLLAHNYFSTNEVSKAEPLAARTLDLVTKTLGPEHPLVARCLYTLGTVTNDLKKAEPALKRALEIAEKTQGPDDRLVATVLNQLSIYYITEKKYEEAEKLLHRAFAINEKKLGPTNIGIVANLLNLGLIARQKKDYEQAEQKYKKAIALVEESFNAENPRLAMILNNLANIYRARGEYDRSLEAHHRVLRITERTRGPYHPFTLLSLGNIAKTYAAKGDMEKAIQFQSKVDQVIERNIDLNLAIGSERQKLSYLNGIADRVDRTISLHANLAPESLAASELAAQIILQRKGRVLDAMSESFALLRRRATSEEQALLKQYNDVTARLASLVLDGPERMSFAEHQKTVADLETKKEELEAEISRRSAEFRAQSQPVLLSAVQAAIPENAALIEFFVYRPFDPKAENNNEAYSSPRYIAYVLRHGKEVLWRELGDAATIDLVIDAFRKALRDPKQKEIKQAARVADEKIFQPIRPLLSDATHLLISPDGPLNLIPFESLVDEQNRYLIERFSFSYLTSGRDLLRLQIARNSKTAAVVIADPMFGEPESMQTANTGETPELSKRESVTTGAELSDVYFAPLAGTAAEAKAIQSLFPEASVLTGRDATESSLKRIFSPSILHIATHGFFLTGVSSQDSITKGTRAINTTSKIENPLLRSGLALAGANLQEKGKEDGILTALEASGLNLWGTKLVTLSACDTGVGEVQYGQGVYGLRRAFVLAGTETLVMSLWPVSDYITRDLMANYYRGLKAGLGRGEALRQMQLGMLKRKGRQHPFFWAGFIQSGEWADLEGQR
jgi:CHAT domain-containing protein/tetratricopeptide (TPR) repeat protein